MSTPNIIVTGGAGYIGSHTCKALANAGFTPITLDNLSSGFERLVKWGALEVGDISNHEWLLSMLTKYSPHAIIHCAGVISVSESIQNPDHYFHHNLQASKILLDAMQQTGVTRLIYSSSASVYGYTSHQPISEQQACSPQNPYAESKWLTEQAIHEHVKTYGLSAVILRYFNAAGADADGEAGELHEPETHLVPLAINAALTNTEFTVFGTDYNTPDGTAIRDYIHVTDVAQAHVTALRYILSDEGGHTFNIGTGYGNSVYDVVKAIEQISGKTLRLQRAPARVGDVPTLIADIQKAQEVIAFKPEHSSLSNIIKTALAWHRQNEIRV